MEEIGPISLDYLVGVGNGRVYHNPPNLFEDCLIDESDTFPANFNSDIFIFFLKNIIVTHTETVSPDGSDHEAHHEAVSFYRIEILRTEFMANAEDTALNMVLSFAKEYAGRVGLNLLSPEQIEAVAKDLASVALQAAESPVLAGSPSASGHRALPVFLNIYNYQLPLDEWESFDLALAESSEEQGISTIPAAASAIEALVACAVASEEPCVVCFENMGGELDAVKLPCSHIYHRECAVKWLELCHLCPLCRYAMPTAETNGN